MRPNCKLIGLIADSLKKGGIMKMVKSKSRLFSFLAVFLILIMVGCNSSGSATSENETSVNEMNEANSTLAESTDTSETTMESENESTEDKTKSEDKNQDKE